MDSASPLSDRLSITALVVSLVALIIGISSFLQAILGTAEGYRKCAVSVIGPWSKLRRRVFRWSEFRFETRFRAPLIKIMTTAEFTAAQYGEHAGNILLLNEKAGDMPQRPSRTWIEWLLGRHDPAVILKDALHLPEFQSLHNRQRKTAHLDAEMFLVEDALGDTVHMSSKLERTISDRTASTSKDRSTTFRTKQAVARDTLLVSWVRFMFELHVVSGRYWPNELCDRDSCTGDHSAQHHHSELAASLAQEDVKNFYGSQWAASQRTKIAVVILEWTWDFMPADVTRPLAHTTLGEVLILALRLGMQWRTLDRIRSQLSADGNGRSIASTDIRGLGMVLRFSTTGQPDYTRLNIIPSRAADKLMCGIVPGDADLVKRDFDFIDNNRQVINMWEPGSVYVQIGLDEDTIEMLKTQARWSTHNEIVTLLCTFLPLPGSQLRGFLFPAWKRRQYSVFHFFEPRLKFLVALRPLQKTSETLTFVLKTLETIAERFKYSYYATYVKDKPINQLSLEREQADLTEFCAKAFRETTIYFQGQGYDVQPKNFDSTWYTQLLAAHARLSAHVNKSPDCSKATQPAEIAADILELFGKEGVDSSYFAVHLWKQTEMYIDGIDNPEFGIVDYMKRRAFRKPDQEIKDAWWMLMLRGVLWDLSCDCYAYPGEPVVSSCFSDETPIWFT